MDGEYRECGQKHSSFEAHFYDYAVIVDEDLMCHTYLQTFISPTDLQSCHTFCQHCLQKSLQVQKICPIYLQPTSPKDTSSYSLVLNKVIDKLPVKRPPPIANFGQVVDLPRGDIEDLLKHRFRVLTSSLLLFELSSSAGITRLPVLEGEVCHIEIPRLSPVLGITIVGGSDTALRCIVVQEVFPDGLVARDGRLKPGDQLVEINGMDMIGASHHQACHALRKRKSLVLRLGVYRERIVPYENQSNSQYVILTVTLERKHHQELGIRLFKSKLETGIQIMDVVPCSPAARGGLCPLDRVVFVNDEDVTDCDVNRVATLLQLQGSGKVTVVVSRKRNTFPGLHTRANSAPEPYYSDNSPSSSSSSTLSHNSESYDTFTPSVAPPYYEQNNYKRHFPTQELPHKHITIFKEPKESLGMRIGGGVGSNEGDIPIYIANIHPDGYVGKSQRIRRGDILMEVNGSSLVGLTHGQAVANLKATMDKTRVDMSIIEGPETSFGAFNFIPSWIFWQKLPRCLQFPKTVVLYRTPGASLGFSIVGGEDPTRGAQHIHVLFVVQNSPAAEDGKLRCGDRLLSVDGQPLEKVEHAEAVTMLKLTGTRVVLEIVSWLGTEL